MRMKESWGCCPSSVLVWIHSSPRAIRSAPGYACTLNFSGMRLEITAWPANGDNVVPSASYFGHVTIMPVMPPVLLGPLVVVPVDVVVLAPVVTVRGLAVSGHASRPLTGS